MSFSLYQFEETSAQVPFRLAWDQAGVQNMAYNTRLPGHSEGFFQPLGANSTINMGYLKELSLTHKKTLKILNSSCSLTCCRYNPMAVASSGAEEVVSVSVAGQTQTVNGYIPGWML